MFVVTHNPQRKITIIKVFETSSDELESMNWVCPFKPVWTNIFEPQYPLAQLNLPELNKPAQIGCLFLVWRVLSTAIHVHIITIHAWVIFCHSKHIHGLIFQKKFTLCTSCADTWYVQVNSYFSVLEFFLFLV